MRMNQRKELMGKSGIKYVLSVLVMIGICVCGGEAVRGRNVFTTMGHRDTLTAVTVVGREERGKNYTCDISMLAGSEMFEKKLESAMEQSGMSVEKREAVQSMLRLVRSIGKSKRKEHNYRVWNPRGV
jgi:hypothetical protein